MKVDLRIKNIVLIGLFPIQNFDKYFFIKNKIVTEEEINPQSVFNAIGAVQLQTDSFQIVVQSNQIIVTDLKPENNNNNIAPILEKIILSAVLTNITAMGFNFHWYGSDDSKTLEVLSKGLFYNDKIKLLSDYFNTDDSRYGLYASANFKDSRLKLDVKPSTIQEVNTQLQHNVIAFIFNFHFDLTSDNNGMVFKCISEYELYINESNTIISTYNQ